MKIHFRVFITCIVIILSTNIIAQKYISLQLYGDTTTNDQPCIKVYLAQNGNGAAVIACPGGGYSYEELNKEGSAFAPWFNKQGIALVVLKYRLPNGNPQLPLADVEKAMSIVKENADKWGIAKDKIGIMGCSAGGHVASTLSTHFHNDTRPAFQILVYPVITMDKNFTHPGSRTKLMGSNPTKKTEHLFSNELQVSPQTPPAFIVLSHDDKIVSPVNSIQYYLALLRNGVSAEMHIYPTGGHGWAYNEKFKYQSEWLMELNRWLTNTLK